MLVPCRGARRRRAPAMRADRRGRTSGTAARHDRRAGSQSCNRPASAALAERRPGGVVAAPPSARARAKAMPNRGRGGGCAAGALSQARRQQPDGSGAEEVERGVRCNTGTCTARADGNEGPTSAGGASALCARRPPFSAPRPTECGHWDRRLPTYTLWYLTLRWSQCLSICGMHRQWRCTLNSCVTQRATNCDLFSTTTSTTTTACLQ